MIVNYVHVSLLLPCAEAEAEAGEKGSPPEQDESLLDNWIKELESGIKGMEDVAGVPAEVCVSTILFVHSYNCTHYNYAFYVCCVSKLLEC